VKKTALPGKYEWDVHLTVEEPEIPAWWTKTDVKIYHGLWDKRIDLVVHNTHAIWIMEITPKVSKAAIGGCLAYQELYEKQFKPDLPVKLGIIVEMDDPNYHSTLKKLGIQLWVV